MKDLVTVDHKKYDLEENKALQIAGIFQPMLSKMVELEENFNEIAIKEITPEVCKEARELRLKYVKVRTGTAEIHKKQKEHYLNGGRFVDGWKNAQIMASEGKEEKLKEIEEHYERIEQNRLDDLRNSRSDLLFDINTPDPENLRSMTTEEWDSFYDKSATAYEEKREADRIAEEARIKAEQEEAARLEAERIENERIRKENEQLKADAEAAEAEKEKERKEKQDLQDEIDRIEKEKQDKEEAEAKAEEEQIQADLRKGDSDKFNDLVSDIEQIKEKYKGKFKSEKFNTLFEIVFDKIIEAFEEGIK